MVRAYYLAVDGGGTKTVFLLLDEKFEVVDRFVGGGTNHERMTNSFEDVKLELKRCTDTLLGRNGIPRELVRDIVAGMSGADNISQCAMLENCFREIGFPNALVINDGFLPVKAECSSGIAYNCGTGVCCNAIDEDGRMIKFGGLDEWCGDMGGGEWILQAIYTAVYNEEMLGGRATALTQHYYKSMNCGPESLVDSLERLKTQPDCKRTVIAGLFPLADGGDAVAEEICWRMRARAVEYLNAVCRAANFTLFPVKIVLTGSVLTRAATNCFREKLVQLLADTLEIPHRVCCTEKEPVCGAQHWLQERNQA